MKDLPDVHQIELKSRIHLPPNNWFYGFKLKEEETSEGPVRLYYFFPKPVGQEKALFNLKDQQL